jgi:flagellar hook-length control protein FliK
LPVPSVASETNTPALKPPALPASRPLPAPDAAPPAPFASLIDDGTQSATPAPSNPPADSAAGQANAPSTAATPAATDSTAKADASAKPVKADQKAKTDKSAGDGKTDAAKSGNDNADKVKAAVKTVADAAPDPSEQTTADVKTAAVGKDSTDAPSDSKSDAKTTVEAAAIAGIQTSVKEDTQTSAKAKKTEDKKTSDSDASKSADASAPPAIDAAAALIAVPTTPAVAAPAKPEGKDTAITAAGTTNDKSAASALLQAIGGDAGTDGKTAVKESQTTPDDGKTPADSGDAVKQALADARTGGNTAVHHTAPDTQPAPVTAASLAGVKADSVQPLALGALPQHSAPTGAAAPAPAAQALPQTPVPLAGVGLAIAGRALAGGNRFEIRLDPPELGRIDVRLVVDKDGSVTSHLIADNKNTLNLLQQDASGLQRALQNAGLKTSDNGLQFSLRDQSSGTPQNGNPTPAAAPAIAEDDTLQPIALPSSSYAQLAALRGGLDIRV